MALLNTLGGMVRNTRKSKPARRRAPSFSTHVESLESRCLMTASVGFQLDQLNGGTVMIQGTSQNDDITVELRYNSRNDPNYFGFANDQLVVKQDGNVISQTFINADVNLPGTSYINKIEFHGGNGNDTFHNDTMLALKAWGDAGNDVIYGGGGNDILYGGHGNDRLYGGAGHDDLYGEAGHDRLEGGEGSDYLYGGDGNDYLYGGMDNDNLDGGNGHDYLYGGGGSDLFSDTHGDYWTQHGPNQHV
jgi:Ca2+-binding RTX toxin-like protein